ncbi:MAG: ABC transporter permease [Alphaproteobacteria bacterium]|nr:ABC transporter permease [Alphaproteobacteria bacterium]
MAIEDSADQGAAKRETLSLWRRIGRRSELAYLFLRSPPAMIGALLTVLSLGATLFAPWVAPTDPFDLAAYDLLDSLLPPAWAAGGEARFLLGTDDQGRDMLSAILYGARISVLIGGASIAFAAILGVTLGLAAAYLGGWFDHVVMRIADVQLALPAILTALLIDGVARGVLPSESHDRLMIPVLILAIGLSLWVDFARLARASALVERDKDYVQAAEIMGLPAWRIMLSHILPNIAGPILVVLTIDLAVAILLEATLSFLGVGVPADQASLGTLIRIGTAYIFSGEWWIALFPSLALVLMVIAVNLLGDFLRDALNPKLR